MRKWLIVFLLIVLAVSGLIAWRIIQTRAKNSAQTGMRTARSKSAASIEVAGTKFRDIVNTFEATGSVEAIQNVKISPKVTGSIEYLQVREGDRVRQGEVLVRIDQTEIQAEVRQQQASLAEAKYRLAQAQLNQTPNDTAVNTQIHQQEAAVANAQSDLHQMEETLKAQLEAVKATIADAQSKIDSANAIIANANANIGSAQANLDNATQKYNRTFNLYKQGYVAAQDVDDAKTVVSVQQAGVEVARGQLQSAIAALNSVTAQKRNTEEQANIIREKADADVASARAKYVQAKAALEFARANAKQTPAFQQNLDALRAAVSIAKASLDSTYSKLSDTVLRSPLDGVVTARNQDLGSLAAPGQPILTVQAMQKVWATIAVPEDVSAKIHLNQLATVAFDALGGRSFTGRIVQINPSADTQSRQFVVRVMLDNRQHLFTAGMFARVSLITAQAMHVLSVPYEAVETDPDTNNDFVWVVSKDSTAQARPVTKGIADAKWIAILSGLRPGEKVITMSASPLREGQKVRAGGKSGKGKGGKPAGAGAGADAAPAGTATDAPVAGAPRGGRHKRSAGGTPTPSMPGGQ